MVIAENQWTEELVAQFCQVAASAANYSLGEILAYLNGHWPLPLYKEQRARRQRALANLTQVKTELLDGDLLFPEVRAVKGSFELAPFARTAILLTAGGEGERLRCSLQAAGFSEARLSAFTKASWPLDNQTYAASTLGYNLTLCRAIGRALGKKLPVIVTLGPAGSSTAQIIPEYVKTFADDFLDIMIVCQEERLHLAADDRLVLTADPDLRAVVNPDETGGPFMALKKPHERDREGLLAFLEKQGIENIVALQGTTICQPELVSALAGALTAYEVAAVGVRRPQFAATDAFGTFVKVQNGGRAKTVIVEAHARPAEMLAITSPEYGYLPYNSGMYAFKCHLLQAASLPDFISPPKIICENLPKAGKVGYAAIDLLSLSRKAVICLCGPGDFAALKDYSDFENLQTQAVKLVSKLPYLA